MTALPAVVILAAVAVYLACEHRLRQAVTVQDGRDRDDVAVAWVASLTPARLQVIGEQVSWQRPYPDTEGVGWQRVSATVAYPLAAFAAALAQPPLSRWRRWRWRVGDWWEATVTGVLDGGSARWRPPS